MPVDIKKAANISPGTGVPTAEELAEINKFTRRELAAEEVYTFSVVLCDNEIDRDCEQFVPEALKKLAELFAGKSGGYNHSGNAHEQVMRIYDAAAQAHDVKQNSVGEPYVRLQAKAYLLRGKENEKLINAIDAGIRKEVSVSCAVRGVTCSICGKPPSVDGGCTHMRGKEYDGKLCYRILSDPSDAYEFSFVMVPAQPAAGVTKSKSPGGEEIDEMEETNLTEQEIREKYPEVVTAIEKAAGDAAAAAAVTEERARLKGIQSLASKAEPEMAEEAMFGETACDKATFAVRVLEAMKDDGKAALEAMEKAGEAAAKVKAAGNHGDVPGTPGGAEELSAQDIADIEKAAMAFNKENGRATKCT